MSSPSPTAASAESLLRATAREHLEGDPVLLQDLQAHLSALRLQAAHCATTSLRRLMAVEIGCIETVLRRFSVVRVEARDLPGVRANAESALAEVRAYAARQEYAYATGYAESALERIISFLPS